MRILLLANPVSSHTIKWVNALCSKGVEVCLVSLNPAEEGLFADNEAVQTLNAGLGNKAVSTRPGSLSKVIYLKLLPKIKKAIKRFRPDVLHAHYASSYGLLGSLSGFHPFVLSVWGSDIYSYPYQSIFHRFLIKYPLKRADWVLSTSAAMGNKIREFSDKKVEITPFGIDKPFFQVERVHSHNEIVIGTVKLLKKIYGIDVLIKAFNLVRRRNPQKKLKLLIVGDGPERNKLERLVTELDLSQHVEFTGYKAPELIPSFLKQMDIFAALSVIDESFGVAVLEAGATGLPSVVSNVPGFREIIRDGETGIIVPVQDIEEAANAIDRLVKDDILRESIGKNANHHVANFYNLETSVNKMMQVYKNAILKSER